MRRWLLPIAIGALAAALYASWPREASKRAVAANASADSSSAVDAPAAQAARDRANPAPGPSAAPHLDRAKADEMREKIRAVLADAGPLWGEDEAPSAPAPLPRGVHRNADGTYAEMPDPDSDAGRVEMNKYIQSRIHDDLFPLAKQCYTTELEKDPKLAGRIVLDFTIAGDTRIGGVVDTAAVGKGTTLVSPSFVECMTQSMMSVSFDAPPKSGKVTVSFPIEFSPDDDDDGGAPSHD